jgi:hypothetical protein
MELSWGKGDTIDQALADVGQVTIRIPLGGHALVHLNEMDALPRDFLACQELEHEPGRAAAADGQEEAAAACHRGSCLGGDEDCGPVRDRLRIGKNVELHRSLSRRAVPNKVRNGGQEL